MPRRANPTIIRRSRPWSPRCGRRAKASPRPSRYRDDWPTTAARTPGRVQMVGFWAAGAIPGSWIAIRPRTILRDRRGRPTACRRWNSTPAARSFRSSTATFIGFKRPQPYPTSICTGSKPSISLPAARRGRRSTCDRNRTSCAIGMAARSTGKVCSWPADSLKPASR